MKYFEYGVRSYETINFIGKFGEDSNKSWEHVVDGLTRLGIQGWEIYNTFEKNNVIHFLFRKEISKEDAENIFMIKDEDTYPLGFVDHIRPRFKKVD
jgi:hypothetical protein